MAFTDSEAKEATDAEHCFDPGQGSLTLASVMNSLKPCPYQAIPYPHLSRRWSVQLNLSLV